MKKEGGKCPDCGMELSDCSDETLNKHFKGECQGIIANSVRAYGCLDDANMEWISCETCGCIEYVFNEAGEAVCAKCGTLFHEVEISGPKISLFERVKRRLFGV